MAAATALAVTSAAVGAGQMIMGAQQKKKAEAAADKAMAEQRALIEQGVVNQYAGLQAQTGAFDLAEQQTQRAVTEATVATQESGAEGVIGGVGNIIQAQQEAGLQTAVKRAEEEGRVEQLKAGEQSRIDQMKYQGLVGLSQQELMGAQAAAAEGRQMQMAGLQGLASGLAGAAGAVQSDRAADDWGKSSSQAMQPSIQDQEAMRKFLSSQSAAQTQQGNNLTYEQLIGLIGQAQ